MLDNNAVKHVSHSGSEFYKFERLVYKAFDADSFALSAACCAVCDCWPHAASVAASAIAVKAASVRVFMIVSPGS